MEVTKEELIPASDAPCSACAKIGLRAATLDREPWAILLSIITDPELVVALVTEARRGFQVAGISGELVNDLTIEYLRLLGGQAGNLIKSKDSA